MMHSYKRILRSILPAIIALTICMGAEAYVVNSVTGNVKILSGGKVTSAEKGARLSESDNVSIPEGGMIKILDENTNKEYQSVSAGTMTVGRLIARAADKAADNASQINSIVNFPSGRDKALTATYVHREKGMVTRSLNIFDEDGASVEITPEALARLVAYAVYFGKETSNSAVGFKGYDNEPIIEGTQFRETGFMLHNAMDTPVYFNVLKLSGIVERTAEISTLGQPGGFYILPPGHTMWRTMPDPPAFGEKHVVVACHYSFNIDRLIEALNEIINDTNLITDFPDTTLPVYIRLI